VFNCTYPSLGNPYTLDLSEPYRAAVLEELMVSHAILSRGVYISMRGVSLPGFAWHEARTCEENNTEQKNCA
jgi:hypothetical protein